MSTSLYRRSSWYERILASFLIQLALGFFIIILIPSLSLWGWEFWIQAKDVYVNSLIVASLAFISVAIILRRILRYPGERVAAYIVPTILVMAAISITIVLLLRLPYSNSYLAFSLILSILWFSAGHFIVRNWRTVNLAFVPFGLAKNFDSSKNINIVYLDSPQLPDEHIDGIVADLHSDDITPDWERFIANCTLQHIPVYHIKQIRESLTGRVKINHLSENEFGTLLPSPFYQAQKRIIDIIAVLLIAPIAVILTLIAGILITRESKGGIFFTQDRIGYRAKPFKLYKIRTMRTDISGKAVTEGEEDPRITPLGKVLRKYRVDELPQLLNVLKGDMGLIGPRPGPVDLEKWYEEKIPFFAYRHVVRPGLSGWAQVMQGYAESADEMNEKLEYDFYYIKHFSLWLDMLIVYKTIKTILTGFGSR